MVCESEKASSLLSRSITPELGDEAAGNEVQSSKAWSSMTDTCKSLEESDQQEQGNSIPKPESKHEPTYDDHSVFDQKANSNQGDNVSTDAPQYDWTPAVDDVFENRDHAT
jgi:hypothetical protein